MAPDSRRNSIKHGKRILPTALDRAMRRTTQRQDMTAYNPHLIYPPYAVTLNIGRRPHSAPWQLPSFLIK